MKQNIVPTETIQKAIAIIGDSDNNATIESGLLGITQNKMTALRLKCWIPEAFGYVFVDHIGGIKMPSCFSAKTKLGTWENIDLSREPIFTKSVEIAEYVYANGPRQLFQRVSIQSSFVSAINSAARAGEKLVGGSINGPALIGIPAEIYEEKPAWFNIWKCLTSR